MKVEIVPLLSDNFCYLLICEETRQAGIVDPAEAGPVIAAVERLEVTPVAILNTHHHWDHTGGNAELVAKYPGLKVYAHTSDKGRIEAQTDFVHAGDRFVIGNVGVEVLHNPGHTNGHVSYRARDAVFTGDTMFGGGCGRLFEGTPGDMHVSLNQMLGGLPGETKVFFGHEYTEANLRFALDVEPDNEALRARMEHVLEIRARGEFTTPSSIAEEWATNPFMRVDSPTIQARVKQEDPSNDLSPTEVLRVVRELKNKS